MKHSSWLIASSLEMFVLAPLPFRHVVKYETG
jgi:hypothetical protein